MTRRTHPGMAAEARRLMERHRAHQQADQLAIDFARPFPVCPPAPSTEQLVAAIPTTNQHGYEAWKQSEVGAQVFGAVRDRALALAAAGEQRIGTKALFEWCRAHLKIVCNNTWTAFVARELRDAYPVLRDRIECRERKAT